MGVDVDTRQLRLGISTGFRGSVISNRSTSSTSSLSIAAAYASPSPASQAIALWAPVGPIPVNVEVPEPLDQQRGFVGSSMS